MNLRVGLYLSILMLSGCTHENSLKQANSIQSWIADNLVVYNNTIYLGTGKILAVTDIQEKIGEINYFSDKEASAKKNNFSNSYPVGTKLYKIKDIPIQSGIAIETSKGIYILAQKKVN